jgi:hypothetical protein
MYRATTVKANTEARLLRWWNLKTRGRYPDLRQQLHSTQRVPGIDGLRANLNLPRVWRWFLPSPGRATTTLNFITDAHIASSLRNDMRMKS